MKKFAVIFDMDGVLVHSNPAHKKSLIQFCLKHGFTLSEEELRAKIYGRTNNDWIRNLFGNIAQEQVNQYADEKEALFREIYAPDVAPVKGLIGFLEMLEKEQIKKAIGTSAPPANVVFTLKGTKTERYFQTILDETYVTKGKPNPEIYLKVAQALAMPPEKCVVIEDSISGVQAGLSAGCKVIGITTTHTAEELSNTHLIINDFDELTLDKLNSLF